MDLYTLPTPYPDETWYSIVSRYHRKSGNTKSTITSRELFGGTITSQKRVNPLALDNTIVDYVRLHGPTIGTAEKCFSKYTLAPYQMRYYSEKRKEEVLERIFDASELKKTFVFTNHMYSRKQTMLRYCPLCLQEDIEKYGEAYWHRVHQIWVMDKCHKHGCNLLDADMSLSKATYHFTCADEISCPNDKVTYNESPFDSFTQYAFAALNAPFSFHCDADVDALIYAAVDGGYGKFYSRGFMCDAHKMYEDIQKKFGEEFIKKFFTADNGGATIRRVFRPNWNSRVEPAILVATFLQAPIEKLFDKIDRDAEVKEELLKCSTHNVWWPKKNLARHLGIKMSRLDLMAKELNIKPFWEESPKADDMVSFKASFYFTEKEMKAINAKVKSLHMASKKDFFAYCVKKEVGLVKE